VRRLRRTVADEPGALEDSYEPRVVEIVVGEPGGPCRQAASISRPGVGVEELAREDHPAAVSSR
jgi:hypothetical protein